MAAIGHGEVYIIPATDETRGHGTTDSRAALYADRLAEFPRRRAEDVTPAEDGPAGCRRVVSLARALSAAAHSRAE